MTTKTDSVELLASFRPTDEQLEHEWPAAQRAAMRESIRTNASPTAAVTRFAHPARRVRKPWPAIAGLVGAAAAALLVVQIMQPSDTPGGPPKAAASPLARLAAAAQATPADVVDPGEFRHLVVTQSDQRVLESWTSYSGVIWRRDDNAGAVEYLKFPHTRDYFSSASPRFLASLPTDPDQLQSYLLSHVCGSTSRDEAVFAGVADMLRGDFAPTALRVAAIRVLERTGHITTHPATDTHGHSALQVDFVDAANRPGETQSLLFDPSTSALLQDQTWGGGANFTETYSDSSTVASVPADVSAKAVTQEDTPGDPTPPPGCTWDKNK